jgi:hypothetical protein
MRQAEVDGFASNVPGRGWLASILIGEFNLRRVNAEVLPKHGPQQTAPGDEPIPVAIELESFRPRSLAGGKRFGQRDQFANHSVQRRAPDMHFICAKTQMRRRERPATINGRESSHRSAHKRD